MTGRILMHVLIFMGLCLFVSLDVFSQDPKPPEAELDTASTFFGGVVSIQVLLNDFGEDGHPIKVVNVVPSEYSECFFNDSLVFYRSKYLYGNYIPETDTIKYRIQDMVNGLLSDFGKIALSILPVNFNNARDSININNYNAAFHACGNYFFDYYGDNQPFFEIPKGSGLNTLRRSYLLIGGHRDIYYDHVSAEFDKEYYISDFWQGPVSNTECYNFNYDSVWNVVWKLAHSDIELHKSSWLDPTYNMPLEIESWPGNGDEEAGQLARLAPFYDKNGNDIYEPLLGDYPAIKGDVAIFSLYNDQRTIGLASDSKPVELDIQQMVYAFDCVQDSVFNNSLFENYKITNRSENHYNDVYCGIYSAFVIGNEGDEYMGCDTLLNYYYGYNDSVDEPNGSLPGYSQFPPAQAVCFLNEDLSSFIGPREGSWNGPGVYLNLLTGVWPALNIPMTYGGNGMGGTDVTTFLFPGNPSDPFQWSDFQVNPTEPGQRNGIGACGPFEFGPGEIIELDIAYVFARDYGGTNLSSVDLLNERVSELKWFYDNDSTPCGRTWSASKDLVYNIPEIKIYPNPADDYFMLETPFNFPFEINILDLTGRKVWKGAIRKNQSLDVSFLKPGIYVITIPNSDNHFNKKLIVR